LIVSNEHIANIHALNDHKDKEEILTAIQEVSQLIAQYLNDPVATYTLMTNVGPNRQGIPHLHVHFKSDSTLDESALEKCQQEKSEPHQNVFDGTIQHIETNSSKSINSRRKFPAISAIGVAAVIAVAAWGIWSWWSRK